MPGFIGLLVRKRLSKSSYQEAKHKLETVFAHFQPTEEDSVEWFQFAQTQTHTDVKGFSTSANGPCCEIGSNFLASRNRTRAMG